jgi:hypothetical protein
MSSEQDLEHLTLLIGDKPIEDKCILSDVCVHRDRHLSSHVTKRTERRGGCHDAVPDTTNVNKSVGGTRVDELSPQ